MTLDARPARPGPLACPRCRAPLSQAPLAGDAEPALRCSLCDARYPVRFGIPDLRLAADPWIGIDDEVAKIERVLARAAGRGYAETVRAYWEETPATPRGLAARYAALVSGGIDREGAIVARLVERLSAGAGASRVLEIGCGTGGFCAAAARRGLASAGVDVALRWLAIAKRRFAELGVDPLLAAASIDALPFADGAFDFVIGADVIDHLRAPASGLAEVRRVLAPGGHLYLSTPNRFSVAPDPHVRVPFVGWLPRRLQGAWVQLAGGVPFRETFLVSARDVERLLAAAGFDEIRVEPAEPVPGDGARLAGVEARLLPIYERLRASGVGRRVLRALGPLLEATARAPRG